MAALVLFLLNARGACDAVELHSLGYARRCAFVSPRSSGLWQRSFSQCRPQRSSWKPSTVSSSISAQPQADEPTSHRRYQHPSQPVPDMESTRRAPIFPGAIPIDTKIDVTTCINQIGQSGTTNALLGKPSHCQCRHGYAQAFSLDPVPPVQKFKRKKLGRLNSGLLKLTCPLLVSSVDILEDDGFMKELNAKLLAESEGKENEFQKCMDSAHKKHASTRQDLILGGKTDDVDKSTGNSSKIQMLHSKLGERGADAFLKAGVAGANPLAKTVDVKCLHAWLADYLFAINNDPSTTEHPIGEAIMEALEERGVDISGTDTCNEVCSGRSESSRSSDESIAVEVPIPRNKQRRKRRQLEKKDEINQ